VRSDGSNSAAGLVVLVAADFDQASQGFLWLFGPALEESVERRQIGGVLDILIQVCEDVLVGEHKLEVVPEGGTQLVHSLLVLLLLERSADVGADGLELGDELDDERR
jgi:hypothetical protein